MDSEKSRDKLFASGDGRLICFKSLSLCVSVEMEVEVVDMIQGIAKVYIENSRINIELSRDKVFASENGHLICICK